MRNIALAISFFAGLICAGVAIWGWFSGFISPWFLVALTIAPLVQLLAAQFSSKVPFSGDT
jgi:uncharacterized membrane protein